ncbi:MAG: undecaprenyl/decaprenyl-phosphate alpha-N-acetylglucosaminyl 1-phosphate transferase [Chloroflexi bacterium]|nr:undecaprenyl/decaprenyl-phosphate alpha-N-acetylglucosaminyl 1-phosphate transferase [Chloroflexota bacterium]
MDSLQFVPILVVGFATALGLTPVSRQIAMLLGVVDKPNQRKIHTDQKPLMGGLAIFIGFALSLLLFSPEQFMTELGAVVLGAALLALVGLLDDRFSLGIGVRLIAMTAAAIFLISAGIQIHLFNNPLLDIPLTILWVVAITNALNFLDNMDGLCAGLTAICALFFMLIALSQGLVLVSCLAAALMGSAIGFLTYNFNPASTFMGDMGALVLGFTLAVLGIKLEFGSQPLDVTWMVPLLVLAVPIFDINLVVSTRIAEGRSPTEAGKDHTSHRLMSLGLNQRKTLFLLYGACAFFGTIGLLVSAAAPQIAMLVGLAAMLLLALLFVLMFYIRKRYQLRPKL